MLFGYIVDEHYIDLVDEQKKVFKRFKNLHDYNEFCSRFKPSDLHGLSRRETVVKWYDSNFQLAKLLFPFFLLALGVWRTFFT